ncbi:hypothetical protein T492DRAFT_900012, partial [Pavlovales sp. CCMP2436]
MSSRHARAAAAAGHPQADDAEGSGGESSEEEQTRPAARGGFAALLRSDSDGSDSASSEEVDEPPPPPPQALAPHGRGGGGRGKGQKGKKGGRASDDDDALLEAAAVAVRAQAAGVPEPATSPSDGASGARVAALAVERRSLDPDAEMTRLFGSRAIRAATAEAEAEAAAAGGGGGLADAALPRRQQRHQRGRHALTGARASGAAALRARAKRCLLVQPASTWPPSGSGELAMAVDTRGRGGLVTFRLRVRDPQEAARQKAHFEGACSTGDPRALLQLLGAQPWHVPTLLALHRALCQTGQVAEAADMAARALHACELGFSTEFAEQWLLGGARLAADAAEEDCGQLLLRALWHHAGHLQRRGAHASALGVTKLA